MPGIAWLKRHVSIVGAIALTVALGLPAPRAFAQLAETPLVTGSTAEAQALAQALVGPGVTVVPNSATYVGAPRAAGTFSGGGSIIGINTGVLLSSGCITNVTGPNNTSSASCNNGTTGDTNLNTVVGPTTFDASVLQFDFIPTGNQVSFQFVFGSEEYTEYVNSQYNDVFAFYINGQNCAVVNGSPITINSVNQTSNTAYFVNNTDAHLNTQLDGLTITLTCNAPVNPNVSNHAKLAIADRADSSLDSDVFLAGLTAGTCSGVDCLGTTAATPELDSIILFAVGAAGLAALGWRQRRQALAA